MFEENSLETPQDQGEDPAGTRRAPGRLGGLILIVLGLGLIIGFGFDWPRIAPGGSAQDRPKSPEIGARAPDIALQALDGEIVSLADYRGTPVLINFWATWCSPCRLEMPFIQARYEQHGGDLAVLAVDFDEPAEIVAAFRDEFGLTFDVLLDPGGVLQETYEIRGYPTSFFVDAEGVIRAIHVGIMSEGQLDGYLRDLGL